MHVLTVILELMVVVYEPDAVKVACPVCAVRRCVVSLPQAGRTRRKVLGSISLPDAERPTGQEHAEAIDARKTVEGMRTRDPHPMGKARLLEVQSLIGEWALPSETV
jgi:hypothetical protein